MTIEKNQMAKKDAKRREPKHAFAQNKEIRALLQQASDMMQQDSDRAKIWFETKMDVFGGETPMQHARTEKGAREVEDLIGRIRNGVFSQCMDNISNQFTTFQTMAGDYQKYENSYKEDIQSALLSSIM